MCVCVHLQKTHSSARERNQNQETTLIIQKAEFHKLFDLLSLLLLSFITINSLYWSVAYSSQAWQETIMLRSIQPCSNWLSLPHWSCLHNKVEILPLLWILSQGKRAKAPYRSRRGFSVAGSVDNSCKLVLCSLARSDIVNVSEVQHITLQFIRQEAAVLCYYF